MRYLELGKGYCYRVWRTWSRIFFSFIQDPSAKPPEYAFNRNSDMGVGKTGSFADGEFAVRFVTSVSGKN